MSALQELKTYLSAPRRVAIITHARPDGDAVGSTLGWYHYLVKKGHSVTPLVPDEYPRFLNWLPGEQRLVNYEKEGERVQKLLAEAELICCLDFNNLARIGQLGHEVHRSPAKKMMIDHHPQPDGFADFMFSDVKACSTAELVYRLINDLGDEKLIDKDTASCLYVGILTDTGSFRFDNTSAGVLRIAAALTEQGVSGADVYNRVYDSYGENRLRLLGHALPNNMKVLPEHGAAYITLSTEDLRRFNVKTGDTEGLVNYPLGIEGITLSALFTDRTPADPTAGRMIRISFRAKGERDVNQLARAHFGGGGHRHAAGGYSAQTLEETVNKFIRILPDLNK